MGASNGMSEKGEKGTLEQSEQTIRRLIRKSRSWEILTFTMVIVVSPASFLLGLPFGIAPEVWLALWLHWEVVFIVLAMIIALLGFNAASSCWLKAKRIRKQLKEEGPK